MDAGRVIGFCARQSGFRVTIVNNIGEAIAEIDRELPDALITELLFDIGDGVDLIRYLREKARPRRVPVVVITTTTTGYTAGQAQQQGADLFVGKPLATDTLLKALRDLLPLMG
ncbi:MAG: response regulator [Aggregatilineales bacterium]